MNSLFFSDENGFPDNAQLVNEYFENLKSKGVLTLMEKLHYFLHRIDEYF